MGRLKELDTARGALMLYIVTVIHGGFWLHLLPKSVMSLLLFEMPLIFLVSGYAFGVQSSRIDHAWTGVKYWSYLKSRLVRVLLPYFAYAFFCACLVYGLADSSSYSPSFMLLLTAWMNPFVGGDVHSVGMLNWHLWFLPVFLVIVVVLPFAAVLSTRVKVGPLASILALAVLLYAIKDMRVWGGDLLRQCLVFLAFAVAGFRLASSEQRPSTATLGLVVFVCTAVLIATAWHAHDLHAISLQRNKFPPNYLYFLGECIWVAVFLYLSQRFMQFPYATKLLSRLADQVWFRPFVAYGYSIYLWQGLAYTMAAELARRYHLPNLLVCGVAVILAVIFGKWASPLERIKLAA